MAVPQARAERFQTISGPNCEFREFWAPDCGRLDGHFGGDDPSLGPTAPSFRPKSPTVGLQSPDSLPELAPILSFLGYLFQDVGKICPKWSF